MQKHLKDIEAARAKIDALKAERAEIEGATVTREQAEEAARRWIDQRAAEAPRVGIGDFLAGEATGRLFPEPGAMGEAASPLALGRLVRAVEAALCATAPEVIEDQIREDLAAHFADHGPGLDPAEKARRLREIDDGLLSAECDEERAIRAAEAEGQVIERRPDASPVAVLAKVA